MRVVKFIVKNDTIVRDPTCDFSKLQMENHAQAEFEFSKDWDGYVRVVSFERGGIEPTGRVLLHGTTCDIPNEMIHWPFVRIYVIGKKNGVTKKTKTLLLTTT